MVRFRHRLRAGKRRRQTTFGAAGPQKRENFVRSSTDHFFTAKPGNALHRAIPRDDAALAIKREETVDAGVEQTL